MKLTAAGQLQNYTVFPFNSGGIAGNQKRRKSSKIKGYVKWMLQKHQLLSHQYIKQLQKLTKPF